MAFPSRTCKNWISLRAAHTSKKHTPAKQPATRPALCELGATTNLGRVARCCDFGGEDLAPSGFNSSLLRSMYAFRFEGRGVPAGHSAILRRQCGSLLVKCRGGTFKLAEGGSCPKFQYWMWIHLIEFHVPFCTDLLIARAVDARKHQICAHRSNVVNELEHRGAQSSARTNRACTCLLNSQCLPHPVKVTTMRTLR